MGCAASTVETRIAGLTTRVNKPGLNELLRKLELQWSYSQGARIGASAIATRISNKSRLISKFESQDGVASATSNLVILDWDDTLFPSYWLDMTGAMIFGVGFLEKLAEESNALLSETSAAVLDLLIMAMALSEVKIFADCARPWVQDANTQLLHIPKSTLSHAEVTYAPELLTEEDKAKSPKLLPMLAKFRAMDRAVMERRTEAGSPWSNIVCIGGAPAQHLAVQKYMKQLSKRRVCEKYTLKSVKFIERPSLAELLGQLRLLCLWFPKLVALDESVYIRFEADAEQLLAVHRRFKPDEASLNECHVREGR